MTRWSRALCNLSALSSLSDSSTYAFVVSFFTSFTALAGAPYTNGAVTSHKRSWHSWTRPYSRACKFASHPSSSKDLPETSTRKTFQRHTKTHRDTRRHAETRTRMVVEERVPTRGRLNTRSTRPGAVSRNSTGSNDFASSSLSTNTVCFPEGLLSKKDREDFRDSIFCEGKGAWIIHALVERHPQTSMTVSENKGHA